MTPPAAPLRWAVLGPGSIARRFASQLPSSGAGGIVAVGSSAAERARAFADEVAPGARTGTHAEVLADPDVEAVYVATVHTTHARLAIAALRAGKHVLCEKPLAPNHGTAMAVVDAARTSGSVLLEAYMYAFHPQQRALLDLVRSGAVGRVLHVDASFSFAAASPTGRLFDADLAGGGVLDVGGYPVTMARAVAGAALGRPAVLTSLRGGGTVGTTGVDEWAVAALEFDGGVDGGADGGVTATVRTGVRLAEPPAVAVHGTAGSIHLADPWAIGAGTGIVVRRAGEPEQVLTFGPGTEGHLPYAAEAAALARLVEAARRGEDVSAGAAEHSLDDSLATSAVLDRWRAAVGVRYPFERDTAAIPTASGLPLRVASPNPMRYGVVPGLGKPLSRIVMGVDNQPDLAHASALFDAFWEAGGTTFDTSWWYGRGRFEKLLGQWLTNRGLHSEAVVVAKGGHTPECTPQGMTWQLLESLENQQRERAELYLLHRDNPDVPVGEFVDVLNEHADAGRIGVFGVSNWTTERFDEANAWAAANGKRGFSVLSNHFGLAEALDVPWAGCQHVTDAASKRWLTERQVPLLPWSSQARGFFARADPADRRDADLVRCYYSDANFERKRRAEELAAQLGVPATAVALAFVLAQPFPTFPVVGPRSVDELRASTAGLGVQLDEAQVARLDLRDG
ncbi:aldo/keto reductase [Kineococcus sp. SYSU DK018]|uniref:aldo/keto reductase n=1 Tax=Kineococcus sp. SYSU DK018 TaxID=3383139 RepID=UPI003D7C9461